MQEEADKKGLSVITESKKKTHYSWGYLLSWRLKQDLNL